MRFDPVMYALAKKGGSGSTGGGAPADWNAKEGEAGYVKNRTHWEEEGMTEVIPPTTVVFSDGRGMIENGAVFKAGTTYVIKWNGVEYECVAADVFGDALVGDIYTLTGGEFGGESTGEPFVLAYSKEFGGIMVASLDGSAEATVSVTKHGTVVHHLDPKYIKDMYYDTRSSRGSGTVAVLGFKSNGWTADTYEISDEARNYVLNIKKPDYVSVSEVNITINGVTRRFSSATNGVRIYEDFHSETWDGGYDKYQGVYVDVDGGESRMFSIQYGASSEYEPDGKWQVRTPNIDLLNQYFGMDSYGDSAEISFTLYDGELKQIDPKYLPAGAGSGSTMFYCDWGYHMLCQDSNLERPAMPADVESAISKGAIYVNDVSAGFFYVPVYIERGAVSGYRVWCSRRDGDYKVFITDDYNDSPGGDE